MSLKPLKKSDLNKSWMKARQGRPVKIQPEYHLIEAKQRVRDNPNGCRHVWVVYDTDDFPAEHIDEVPLLCARNSTEETEYHAVWSNQCMEQNRLRQTAAFARQQLEQAETAAERKKSEIIEAKKEVRENTVHGITNLYSSDGFASYACSRC